MTECHHGSQKKVAILTCLTALVTALPLYGIKDATAQERFTKNEDIYVPSQFVHWES